MKTTNTNEQGATLESMGAFVLRYGLVVIFVWIGLLKFTEYEAKNIEPFVANSPLWAWAYQSFGLLSLSKIIGVIEISIGLLIATRAIWPATCSMLRRSTRSSRCASSR